VVLVTNVALSHAAMSSVMDGRAGKDEFAELQNLKRIRDEKASLVAHLEAEIEELNSYGSDIGARVEAIEGAVALAEHRGLDPKQKAELLKALLEDLRDDHHQHMPALDHGDNIITLQGGHIALHTEDHPIRLELAAQAEQQVEEVEEVQEAKPQESDARSAGTAITDHVYVPNLWRDSGRAGTINVYNRDEDQPWMQLRGVMAEWENTSAKIMSSKIAKRLSNETASARAVAWKHTPTVLKNAWASLTESAPEVPHGCGDVYVDPARAAWMDHVMRLQMARSGVPAYGQTPAVTPTWLSRHHLTHGLEQSQPAAMPAAAQPPVNSTAPASAPAAMHSAQQGPPAVTFSGASPPGTFVPPTSGMFVGSY